MTNKAGNKRYNKLLSYRNHYYSLGSILNKFMNNLQGNPNDEGELTSGLFKGMTKDTATALGALAPVVGGTVGSVIGGGMQSTAGNVMDGLSNMASAIPGPWGAVAGGGLKVLSGVTNRLFGSKLNEENIANVEGTISGLNNFQSNASSFDTLANTWGNTALGNTNFSNSYIGKDGFFSNKVSNKAQKLRDQMSLANAYVENSLQNNANNITMDTKRNLEAAYAAFGGNLNTAGTSFSTGLSAISTGGTHESNPLGGVPIGIAPDGKPNLVEEGETIYNDYVFSNRLTVPRGLRTKYKLRGNKGLSFADASEQLIKRFEERPNDPLSQNTLHEIMSDLALNQEGIKEKAQQGNRFDNGGPIYNPYKYVADYNGGWFDSEGLYTQSYIDKVRNMSIADVNNAFNEQYKFYTDDANKGTDRWKAINAFYTANPQYKTASTNLTEDALSTIKKLAIDGKPGFMHQFFNDINPTGGTSSTEETPLTEETPPRRENRYFLRGKDAEGNPTVTPMSVTPWEGLNDMGQEFAKAYPTYAFVDKQERPENEGIIYTDYYYDENKPVVEEEKKDDTPPLDLGTSQTASRYAPVAGLGLATLTDAMGLTNKADYREPAKIEGFLNSGSYMPVAWNPIGNKLKTHLFDRNYYSTKLSAAANATRRALTNQATTSGQAIAGILNADNNAMTQLSDTFVKGLEYNRGQEQTSEEFNKGTDLANSQGMLQADTANQNAYSAARTLALNGLGTAAEMRQKERMTTNAAKSANLSGSLESLGNIGNENYSMNVIRALAKAGVFNNISAALLKELNV